MKQGNLAALLHVVTFLMALGAGALAEPRLPVPRSVAKPLGLSIFLLGMGVFAWAAVHLKERFFGNVEPLSDGLVESGPYKWVRHSLYLGMAISALGLALALMSLWSLVGVFVLFVPAGVYRARLEEKALAQTFGRKWKEYTDRTFFMFPPLW